MAWPAKLAERTQQQLATIEAAKLRRRLIPPVGIGFSSNDYLSLTNHPLVKTRMSEAVLQQGCGSTASRLQREHSSFNSLERLFAQFKGTAAALYFGSGYAANLGVLTTYLQAQDIVFSDALNHASLIDGMRLSAAKRIIFAHNNIDQLAQLLQQTPCTGQKFLVVESLFGMDGDEAPLAKYAELCQATDTALIVDEAHAVGIYGKHGSGLIEESGVAEAVFLSINPAGKALAVSGALVAGADWAIDYLIQQARTFIFSTAPPPAVAVALDTTINLVIAHPEYRQLLLARASYLRNLLQSYDIPLLAGRSQIIPVILGENEKALQVAQALQQAGFDVRAIRPPTVPIGSARLRLSLNVSLGEAILSDFAVTLKQILAK